MTPLTAKDELTISKKHLVKSGGKQSLRGHIVTPLVEIRVKDN